MKAVTLLDRLLADPMTRGLDLDSPETTAIRRRIILLKPFLRRLYLDWYGLVVDRLPEVDGRILEVGAGGGFLKQFLPELITSEVFPVPGIDVVADARSLPFADDSMRAIVMTNVFHHVPDVPRFLDEAQRMLNVGGRMIMVEPWNTGWSRFVHERLHNEPMLPEADRWEFESSGPVSTANAALPWIVFSRDRDRLKSHWRFRVVEAEPFMPFRYLLSGGVSLRSLQPGWTYPFWSWVDRLPIFRRFALFALVVAELRG